MLAAEGFWFMFAPMVLFLASAFLGVWKKKPGLFAVAGLFLVLWVAMMYFFRDPARPKPDEMDIVSPTDGVVDIIDRTEDGRVRLQVFLSLLDVHAIRSPATGQVMDQEFIPGEFRSAVHPDSLNVNQRVRAILATRYGPLEFSAISGAIARRVVLPLEEGESLLAGQRIGFVRFGSRSEVILPHGVQPTVAVGQRMVGGVTVVGEPVPDQHHSPTSTDSRMEAVTPEPGLLPWEPVDDAGGGPY